MFALFFYLGCFFSLSISMSISSIRFIDRPLNIKVEIFLNA